MHLNRRQFLYGLSLGMTTVTSGLSAKTIRSESAVHFSRSKQGLIKSNTVNLIISQQTATMTRKHLKMMTVNGTSPAPTLYLKEGDVFTATVKNTLNEDTSIHWHGLLLDTGMDGVPGLSFEGIKPNQSFTYRFPLKQSGTYWYHSHSGFQEQLGLYGAIVIEPKGKDPIQADREHVIVLSDWTDENPHTLLRHLKTEGDFDNYQLPTLAKLVQDIKQKGFKNAVEMRRMWNQMRMSPTDFTDLSGTATFSYLINGSPHRDNWTGLFNKGETVRLRLINASAQSIFDFRVPDLKLTVVGTDGGLVEPVTVDELRIGVAETYDVLIKPTQDVYTVFAQDLSRSGFVSGTLAVQEGLKAPVPAIDKPQWLTMTDMMGNMNHMAHMQHGTSMAPTVNHAYTEYGASVDMRVDNPRTNLDDPGVNLRQTSRKVLTYADLHSVGEALHQQTEPTREIETHLTGNMERYIWGFDGVSFADAKPVHIGIGERVRVTLVNDTMMTHPMHMHGMWSDLRCPNGSFQVRKHTILVHPAQKVSFDVTGEKGRWAWHCHLMYHMEAGMFREVHVS